MGLFKRRPTVDNTLPDDAWLAAGSDRFETTKSRFFGSPETMRAGAQQAQQRGDLAAAAYFYAKAIDISQTWSFSRPGERPDRLDDDLFTEYADLTELLRGLRPQLNLLGSDLGQAVLYMDHLAKTAAQRSAAVRVIKTTGIKL